MTGKLKLGLVGADAAGKGWGPVAHIPALNEIEQIELAALCTSRPESAIAATKAYVAWDYLKRRRQKETRQSILFKIVNTIFSGSALSR